MLRIATEPRRIGTMMPIDRKSASTVEPRKRYSVSAQAAIAPSNSTSAMLTRVTISEFEK
jgi:hypothetical protein